VQAEHKAKIEFIFDLPKRSLSYQKKLFFSSERDAQKQCQKRSVFHD